MLGNASPIPWVATPDAASPRAADNRYRGANLAHASDRTRRTRVKPKNDCDQASTRQRQNVEIDIRADVLYCSADQHRAELY